MKSDLQFIQSLIDSDANVRFAMRIRCQQQQHEWQREMHIPTEVIVNYCLWCGETKEDETAS
jgi:hypothetical protein